MKKFLTLLAVLLVVFTFTINAEAEVQISATSNYVGQQPFKIIAFW